MNFAAVPESLCVNQLSPQALAYVGDAVFELYIRQRFLWPPRRIAQYHRQVVGQVRAEQQAQYLQAIAPALTPQEQDILRQGRNAQTKAPKRLSGQTYQQATAFEALVGYLYLTNPHRLEELFTLLPLPTDI